MAARASDRSSSNTRFIDVPRETVYDAFLDREALAAWLAPDIMTGQVHAFDGRVGGGYRMSLRYFDDVEGNPGKSTEREDHFFARFVELSPPERIVQAVTFDSDDPAFAGEMMMVVTLAAERGGTRVTMDFMDIPPGIPPEANEAGTAQSLDKLARLLEAPSPD